MHEKGVATEIANIGMKYMQENQQKYICVAITSSKLHWQTGGFDPDLAIIGMLEFFYSQRQAILRH